ncbi:MAG: hypothetical protein GY796_10375, partial [Chloroflexi bacterium]|nr:hypothetical protein [Chloroflexota bacterium]
IVDTFEARDSLLTALSISPHVDTFLRGHTDWVWSVAFSPDGQTLASASADGSIILWDTSNTKALATRQPIGQPLTGHSGWVRSLAFSPDGQILASGGTDDTIRLWDPATGQTLGPPLTGHAGFITNLAFSPDGQTLASSSADGTIILWDIPTGEPIGSPLADHTGFVLSVAFSPDGQTLASGSEDSTIILWDISTRLNAGIRQQEQQPQQPLARALTNHQGAVSTVAFSPDGQTLASGSADGTLILWDVETRQPRREPLTGHKSGVNSLAFSPDGQTLISGSEDKTVIAWDAGGRPLGEPMIGHTDSVLGVAFSPNSVADRLAASGSADGTIILWNLDVSQPLAEMLTGAADVVRDVAFSPNGQLLAASNADTTITLWNMATRQPLGPPLTGHEGFVEVVAFRPDGQLLASGSDDRTVILWDVANRQPLVPPLSALAGPVLDLVFSPDGLTLIGSDEDGGIVLWDLSTVLDTSSSVQPPPGSMFPHQAKAVSLSSDGQTLATIGPSAHLLLLWDVNTSQRLSPLLPGHTADIVVTAFSPDGQLLASGGHDAAVILWNVPAALDLPLNQVDTEMIIHHPLLGHTELIWDITFSPDGQLLASGSDDETVMLWDVAARQPLGLPLLSGDRVRSVAFSPDGRTLASAGRNDGAIVLWDSDPESWRNKVCDIVGRNLTPVEWQRYLGNEPYRLTCPDAPRPEPDSQTNLSLPAPTPTVDLSNILVKDPVAIIEEFASDQGFIQTSDNVYIENGQVVWHFKRNGGEQFVYRNIPPFAGNVRLTVRGQVDSWTNNCGILAGIGEKPGSNTGVSIMYGWLGGGCSTNGPLVDAIGVSLEESRQAGNCEFTGNWLWVDSSTPYTAEMEIVDEAVTLSVAGVGSAYGTIRYEGPYTTLWVGNIGRGDWPECTGTIDSVMVEPLD